MEEKVIEIKVIKEEDYNKESEKYPEAIFPKRDNSDRTGCDICGGYSTEKFFGYCGSVLWLCETCYKGLIKPKVKKYSKEVA